MSRKARIPARTEEMASLFCLYFKQCTLHKLTMILSRSIGLPFIRTRTSAINFTMKDQTRPTYGLIAKMTMCFFPSTKITLEKQLG